MSCTVNNDLPLLQNYTINVSMHNCDKICEVIFGKKEFKNYKEENDKLKEILSKLLGHEITFAGIQGYCYTRGLCIGYIVSWVIFNDSPKMCVILYLDENYKPRFFIPRWGNTVIGQDKTPLGWDVGYDFDKKLWCQDFPEQANLIKNELGITDEEDIYNIIHSGILEPNYERCKTEFHAYAKPIW